MNQPIFQKIQGTVAVKNEEKKKHGMFVHICKMYHQIARNIRKKSNQILESTLIEVFQHPWAIKDISKDGYQIHKIKDQKDLEIFSEKILINNYIFNNNGMTLRDILNNYFRPTSSQAKESEQILTNPSDLNLIKVEKFVGVNSFNQEKYNISICKFIQNEETQILLKIDNISLKEKMMQLEEWDHQKDQILFNITHDLKTPLNAIMHMISEAKEQRNPQERNDNLSLAYCNSEMLLSLIHDILDFAQLKEKKLKIDLQDANLLEIVESVLSIMRVQTDLKQIELRMTNLIPLASEQIRTDPRRLKQILINLIGNAIKFTNTGSIDLILSQANSYYKFEIIDTGTGIQPGVISKLCQAFQTFGNEKYKNSTGVGLGLCFCKEIVGMLGPFDKLFIDSIYGKGSKFGFLIADQTENINQIEINDNINNYFTEFAENQGAPDIEEFILSVEKPYRQFQNYQNHTQASSEKHEQCDFLLNQLQQEDQSQEFTTVNVLIADDCLFNIIVLKQQLSKLKEYQFNITQAYNGEMAVNKFKELNKTISNENLSIIFMDCNMPIMDGYKATEQIKQLISEEEYTDVTVIALTAQVLEKSRFYFDLILQKPCSVAELAKVLKREIKIV